MESKFVYPVIPCPLHEDQTIQKIDSNSDAKQMLYCIECVIDAGSQNAIPSNLVTLDKFVSTASLYFSMQSQDLKPNPEVKIPTKFTDILSAKGENLSRLQECTKKEKKAIEEIFNHLTVVLAEKVNQKKKEYMQIIEDQMINACRKYELFEKQLKMAYPKAKEADILFPSKADLQARLKKVTNASELRIFVQDLAEDIQENIKSQNEDDDQKTKEKSLTTLSNILTNINYSTPTFRVSDLSTCDLEVSVKDCLSKFLEQRFTLLNKSLHPKSSFLIRTDWKQIKEWIPEKYSLSPKLLYQSKVDGLTAEAFHSKCDGKGPTITFIKCIFAGSSKDSIIGGFSDKDWNTSGKYVCSTESFIFSLTKRVKCTVSDASKALKSDKTIGPSFGQGHDIGILNASFNDCYIYPNSYNNTAQIVDSQNYAGSGRQTFSIEEIEVYTIL